MKLYFFIIDRIFIFLIRVICYYYMKRTYIFVSINIVWATSRFSLILYFIAHLKKKNVIIYKRSIYIQPWYVILQVRLTMGKSGFQRSSFCYFPYHCTTPRHFTIDISQILKDANARQKAGKIQYYLYNCYLLIQLLWRIVIVTKDSRRRIEVSISTHNCYRNLL